MIKEVKGINFNTWAIDSFAFSSADTTTLLNIALQNPLSAGKGVYLARVMLGLIVDDSTGNGMKILHHFYNPVNNIIKIYPNPTRDELTIDFGSSQDKTCILKLFDVPGKTIFSKILDQSMGKVTLSLKDIPNGIYVCRIMDNSNNILYRDKLLIIK